MEAMNQVLALQEMDSLEHNEQSPEMPAESFLSINCNSDISLIVC